MKNFVIRITDTASLDRQIVVSVVESSNLGRAAQMALDQVEDEAEGAIRFPIFMDIHPAEQFDHVSWMHRN